MPSYNSPASYNEVIADNLPTFADCYRVTPERFPKRSELMEAANRIVGALHDAGYVIIKDRNDPEGGIPGRSR